MLLGRTRQSGFTIVELLAVFAIMILMAAVLLVGFVGYGHVQQQRQVVADIESIFHTARQQSQTLAGNEAYGVFVTASSVAMFAQSATSSPVRTIQIPDSYELTPVFSSGETYLTFARRTGSASASGVVEIFDTRRQATTTITILSSGLVE